MTIENLSYCKNDVINYIDSGLYDAESQDAIDNLKVKVEAILGAKNLTICFDIDDTAIRLESYWRSKDYGGTNETITESYLRENEPAHPCVCNFYLYCLSQGINVIFLTGRREKYRIYTEKLLFNAGYNAYYLLDMKPTDSALSDAEFKAQQIDKYIAEGLVVASMIGDQKTDHVNNATYQCPIPNKWYDVTAYEKAGIMP
jgi:hypothetical protein